MGKAGDAEQAGRRPAPATGDGSALRRCHPAIGKALSTKCIIALFMAISVFLSAFFLLLRLRAPRNSPDDPGTLVGEIQASFILLKPPAQLASHATMLEEEIYRQIGVPNSKVSVSMQTLSFKDATCVEFGILPDQINTSISAQSMRKLRKNLIQLTLQQMNLSLTPSVFGDPLCVEVLGFPGGITMEVELPPYNSYVDYVQPVFNVTLEMSIHQIRGLLAELKKDLEHTLGQALHKGIYLDVTNKNGSTINPPVIVQVSLSPDDRSIYEYEEPQRLKQLAEIITESSSRNLGLNPSIFGRIKDLELAPYLQSFIPSFAPSSSPTPIPSPSMPPYLQPSNLCEHCSCPDFMTIINATFPHRKLMRLPSKAILLQLPTRLHSGKIPLHKKNGNAVATPTFVVTSSQP